MGTPLASLLTSGVAVALLILLAFFGVLVVTKTPVHQIIPRLRGVYDRLTGSHRTDALDDEVEGDDDAPLVINAGHTAVAEIEAPVKKRGLIGRRRRADAIDEADELRLDEYDGDEAFARAAIVAAAEAEAEATRLRDAAPDTEPIARVAKKPVVAPETTPAPRGEQPMLEGDVLYTLPSEDVLTKGAPHKVRSAANDRVVESLTPCWTRSRSTRRSRGSPAARRSPGTRSARAGRQGRAGHRP